MLGRLAVAQGADGLLHDVFDDVGRRVVDTASLFDLRLLFDLSLVGRGKPDHLPKKLPIDLAENFRGEDRELIRAVGVVEPSNNVLEGLVIDLQAGS